MSDLTKIGFLVKVINVNDPRHLDVHEELRRKLEEENPFEYTEIVNVTTPTSANTEFTVTCKTLNRTPKYYLVVKKNKALDVYTSTTEWANNKLYLKATVGSATISILVVG